MLMADNVGEGGILPMRGSLSIWRRLAGGPLWLAEMLMGEVLGV